MLHPINIHIGNNNVVNLYSIPISNWTPGTIAIVPIYEDNLFLEPTDLFNKKLSSFYRMVELSVETDLQGSNSGMPKNRMVTKLIVKIE